ncbi:MAG: hypothetical protein L0Z62_47020 [Gemmataceae bacterium]|nr:hypothetical protein [Gemmataceae bacterium]
MAIRVTMKLRWSGTGDKSFAFSETHWHRLAADIEGAKLPAVLLSNARLYTVGANVELAQLRLSNDAIDGDSEVILPGTAIGGITLRSTVDKHASLAALDSDWPDTCVRLRVLNTPGRWKHLYLAGIPDDVIRVGSTLGPVRNGVLSQWNAYLLQYIITLTSAATPAQRAWAWLGKASTAYARIVRWEQQEGAVARLVAVVRAPGISTLIPAGVVQVTGRVQVTGVRVYNPFGGNPNGEWLVSQILSLNGGTELGYALNASEHLDATNIRLPGKARSVEREYLPITAVQVRGQGRRKRGGKLLAAAGKS